MREGKCTPTCLNYPSDVTPTALRGRPRLHPLRRILNAIFYLVHSAQ
jgi:hypothetical protein